MVQLTLAVAHGLKDTVAEGHQAMAQLRAVAEIILCECGVCGRAGSLVTLITSLSQAMAIHEQILPFPQQVWDLQMTSDLKVSDRVQPLYKLLWSDNSQRLRGSISGALECLEAMLNFYPLSPPEPTVECILTECLCEMQTLNVLLLMTERK